jgi:plasmid stabilization system protein ParE
MTLRYSLSPRAQSDLDEIRVYTARHWGVDQAEPLSANFGMISKP